jgi:hypothetical protein
MVELAAKPDEPVSGRRNPVHEPAVGFPVRRQPFANHNGAGDVLWVPGQNRWKPHARGILGAILGFRALTADSGTFRFRAQAD